MNNYSKEVQTQNKATCNKLLADFINTVYPVLRERLEQGFKTKADGSFYKKDADIKALVNKVFEEHKGDYSTQGANLHQCYFTANYGELVLHVKAKYKTSDVSCDYIDDHIYIQNLNTGNYYDFKERAAFTAEELKEKHAQLLILMDEHTELGYQISRLKRELNV